MSTAVTSITSKQQGGLSTPPQRSISIPLTALWHVIIAIGLAFVSWDVFNMETLTLFGKPADLGTPVQVFIGLLVLLPAVTGVIAAILLLRGINRGRYLSLVLNFGALALSLFALGSLWGIYNSFERLVDGIMANTYMTLGFALAYALFWIAGKMKEGSNLRATGERTALGLAMLTLIAILLASNILAGFNYVLSQYANPATWAVTAIATISGVLLWQILHQGEWFGERPDERTAWQGWFMLSPNIIGFLLFFAGPLLLSFYLSFTDSTVGRVPNVIWFQNYTDLLSLEIQQIEGQDTLAQNALSFGYTVLGEFSLGETRYVLGARDAAFWISLRNTFQFCLLLLPLAIIPALGMSLILNSSLPGVKIFRAIYFLPSVAAVVGTALIWRWLYDPTIGFINYAIASLASFFGFANPDIQWLTSPGVVLIAMVILSAWQVVGYNTVLFLAGLQGIPKDLYEAAQIDGADRWNQFWNVTLPMLSPTTFFVMITTMVTGLQVFNEPYALFPSRPLPENATTTVFNMYREGFFEFQFGYASSIAWVLFILIFGLTLVQFRLNRNEAYE
jgi:ABC-type sugar transport system permease subunit